MITQCFPVFGWQTLTRTIQATDSNGGDTLPLTNGLTYEVWSTSLAGGPASLTWNVAGSSVDYLAIASHSLQGTSIAVQTGPSAVGPWTTVASKVVEGPGALFFPFDAVTPSHVRLEVTSVSAPTTHIGVVYLGSRLQMSRSLAGGHQPVSLDREDKLRTNVTETGNWAGRSVNPRAFKASLSFKNIPEQWYRDNFDPFVENSVLYPFFLVERPLDYPDEVHYCWSTADVEPAHTDVARYLNVQVRAEALPLTTPALDPLRVTSPPYPLRNQEAVMSGALIRGFTTRSILIDQAYQQDGQPDTDYFEAMSVESDIVGGELRSILIDQAYQQDGQPDTDYFEAMSVESDIVGGELRSIVIEQVYQQEGQPDTDYSEALTVESDIIGGELRTIVIQLTYQQDEQTPDDYFEALTVSSDIVGGTLEEA